MVVGKMASFSSVPERPSISQHTWFVLSLTPERSREWKGGRGLALGNLLAPRPAPHICLSSTVTLGHALKDRSQSR